MPDDVKEAIEKNAQGPKSAKGDIGQVEQHALKDQIEADRYLESKKAMKQGRGFRITKLVPPGGA
jgi:hypothetical protein